MSHLGSYLLSVLKKQPARQGYNAAPICTAPGKGENGKEYHRRCKEKEGQLARYMKEYPVFADSYMKMKGMAEDALAQYRRLHPEDYMRFVNVSGITAGLADLNEAVKNNAEDAFVMYERTGQCFSGLHSVDYAESNAKLEAFRNTPKHIAVAGAAGAAAVAAIGGVLYLGGLLGGAMGSSSALLPAAQTAEFAPILSTYLYFVSRVGPRLQQAANSAVEFFQRTIYTSTPALEKAYALNLINGPTLKDLNNSLMKLASIWSMGKVIYHAGESRRVEVNPILGAYGVLGITSTIGKLLKFSPLQTITYSTSLIVCELLAQYYSNGVLPSEADWVRIWGGTFSGMGLLLPMNWLLSGGSKWLVLLGRLENALPFKLPGILRRLSSKVDRWKGWINMFSKPKATLHFLWSSAAINTISFVPIAAFLEKANIKNFTLGLGLREILLSPLRKTLMVHHGFTSLFSLIIYNVLKVPENIPPPVFFPFYSGKGLYEGPWHRFLSEKHTTEEFIQHCWDSLGSCRILFSLDIFLCNQHNLEEEDYALLTQDIKEGKFTTEEIRAMIKYTEEILSTGTSANALHVGYALLAVLKEANTALNNKDIEELIIGHGEKLKALDENLDIAEQIELIDDGWLD